jgi:thymidylate synthase ThyX
MDCSPGARMSFDGTLTGIVARVIAHSVHDGNELITVEMRYPRFIHAEVMTYRQSARNSASSRARSFASTIRSANEEPAFPVEFGKDQRGMSARVLLEGRQLRKAERRWLKARNSAVRQAKKMAKLGVHKQIVNRILEPFLMHTIVFTAERSCFKNIFLQRIHPDAQPEFRALAPKIRDAILASVPRVLASDSEPHLPFVIDEERLTLGRHDLIAVSVARCARASYRDFTGTVDVTADLALYVRLLAGEPPHLSPFEHVAFPLGPGETSGGCFRNFQNFRYTLENQ